MRKIVQIVLFLVCGIPLAAQIPSGYVQTTATVPSLANGQFGASWTNLSSSPQLALLGCVSTFQQTVNGGFDAYGHFSVLLADTAQICPAPSTWTFNITYNCPNPPNTAFMVQVPVTGGGGTEDISTQITAALPPSPCGGATPTFPITIPEGGTGAITQLGANGTLGIPGPVFNVAAFGAVADCTPRGSVSSCTDNTAKIQAAIDAAYATGGSVFLPLNSASTGATVYYITNALNPKGVSIQGVVGSGIAADAGTSKTIVRGAPGKDVFAIGDPTSVGYVNPKTNYIWSDFGIMLDDTVDVSATLGQHRTPQKTCNDVTVTGSSAVITSSECSFSAGDVGQAITITDGTNTLTTTISSVAWNPGYFNSPGQSATLAANWTYASGSNRTALLSLMGLSTAARVGNCALAYDNTTAAAEGAPLRTIFQNLSVQTISATEQNNSCAFFFQDNEPYATTFSNISLENPEWGIVTTLADNPGSNNNEALGDTNIVDNVEFFNTYPWVSYDGGNNAWANGQIVAISTGSGSYGPQLLSYNNPHDLGELYTHDFQIKNVEFEQYGPSGGSGWRVTGYENLLENVALATTLGSTNAQWDASESKCTLCTDGGSLNIGGVMNDFSFDAGTGFSFPLISINDTGFGNSCRVGYIIPPYYNQQSALWHACSGVNSRQNLAFAHKADFVNNGDEAAPYNNQDDLWIWPQDISGYNNNLPRSIMVADSTSESGVYAKINSDTNLAHLQGTATGLIVGQSDTGPNVPATEVHVCVKAKADSGTGNPYFQFLAGSAGDIGEINPALTTSYSTSCWDVNLTSYTGQIASIFVIPGSGFTVDLAWISIHPWGGNLNLTGQMQSASILGPATAPSGACTTNGQWALSQDGAITECVSGTWTTFSSGGNIPGGALGSAVYQTGSGATGVTLANTSASTLCLTETGTGSVGAAPTWGSCAGSAATAFSALTSSTNTSAAMVVGSGASLDFTGTGTIDANLANGAVLPASAGFTATNSSRQLVAAAYTPANCTAGTTGSDCLQLTSGLVPVGNIPTAIPIANIGSAGLSGTAPVSIASTGAISMHVADASDNGYLSSTDWSTFNGKQAALSLIKGTYVDGDLCAYTASGTLLNCNVTPGGTGTVTDGSGTTTTPEFAESTGTAHVIQYRTASQALGDMGAQAALSLLAGTYTNGDWCSYASSGTLLNCNNAVPQVNLSLIKGTYVDGDYCTYTASGTVLNCNSTPSGGGTVTSFSAGNLSPLFTTSVATATSTPALTFSLSNAAQNSVLAGPISGGPGAPSYQTAPTISAANMTSFPTFNQATTGKSGGLTGCTQSAAGDICYWNGSAWLVLTGNASGTKYLQENFLGVPSWTTVSGSGLSGMTAGQVPIAATASTVTSSEALAGAGAAIVTGPASSTSGDAVVYTGTSGQTADVGFAPAPSIGSNTGETSGWTLAANTVYRFTGSGASNATTPASISAGFIASIQNTGTAAVTVVTGGPTLHCEPSSCVVQIGASALITTDANGTDFDEIASNANGTAFGSLANASTINNSNWSGTVLAVANGGTGTGSTLTGLMRGSASAMTAAELSGDATTSGSNAVTVVKINGGSVPASAALLGTNGSSQPTAVTAGTGVITALGVNTGSAGAFGVLIASGTAAMNTASVGSGACETVVTVSATGVATTDTITVGFNTDPTAITGYGASATGAVLTIYPYPTSGNVNFKVCNSTSGSITPGSLTLNWRVAR